MSEPLFFVNRARGRAPEGPFTEAQIVRLILAGKILGSALVCGEGKLRFGPLSSHPPFARALEQSKGGPLQANSEAPKILRKAPPPPSRRSRGLLFGAVLAFFGLAVGAVGIGAYVMFENGGTPAHGALPSNTELLFEIGSLHGAVQSLGGVHVLDPRLAGPAELVEKAALDLSASFEISKSQASALLLAASSLAVAARKLATTPEGGLLLTFSSATPVNAWLNSKHFKYAGLVSSNGRIYKLADAESRPASTSLRVLAGLMREPAQNELVWFETSKVLFLGSKSFALDLARSVALDAPPLSQNLRFQRAQRDFTDKADAIVYIDPTSLTAANVPRLAALLGAGFSKTSPIAASLKLVPSGLLAHVVLHAATPAPVNAAPSWAPPPAESLTVIDRLPRETFAYVAALTKTQLSGAELRRSLQEQIAASDADSAARIASALTQAEAAWQLHIDDVLGSLGDQAALALLAPAEYHLELSTPQQMARNLAVVYVQALTRETPARALFEQLKQHLGRVASQVLVTEDASGYGVAASDASFGLGLQLRFIKGYLCLAIGNEALVLRSVQALTTGENTLTAEPAHQAARAALPSNAQLFAWVDAGRVVSRVLQNPLLAPRAHEVGLDRDAIRWLGPDRVTAALAVSCELHDGLYTYRADSLNAPAFAGLLWGTRAGF